MRQAWGRNWKQLLHFFLAIFLCKRTLLPSSNENHDDRRGRKGKTSIMDGQLQLSFWRAHKVTPLESLGAPSWSPFPCMWQSSQANCVLPAQVTDWFCPQSANSECDLTRPLLGYAVFSFKSWGIMPGGLDGLQLVQLLHRELLQRMATSSATSTWQSLTSEGLQDQCQGLTFSSIFIASLDDDM